MTRWGLVACTAAVFCGLAGCMDRAEMLERAAELSYIDPAELPDQWRTRAERTDYQETGRYHEVVDFCRRLAAASPYADYHTFGASGQGRPLPLLILTKEKLSTLTLQDPATRERPLVLLQNCIHPGECAGKDACLELARDILITGTRKELLSRVDLLIVPIFSPDGHERFSPHSRINQNGPKQMGWRVTAANLNLNRDYTKADAVEMQCWLGLWNRWQPDLFFDNHTTNGSDHQYDLFYSATTGPAVDRHVAGWLADTLLPGILPKLAEDGHLTLPYSWPRDRKDLSKGINAAQGFGPRYSTGYGAICNRPSFLIEAHALKPYRRRVRATYDIMLHTLEELNRRPELLRAAIRAADRECVRARGAAPDGRVALTQSRTDESEPLTYKAVEQRVRASEITGGEVTQYTDIPVDVDTRLYNGVRVEKSVAPPVAYLVPPQWTRVIYRLELHGVEFFRLHRPERLAVETYRLENVKFPERPSEGRHQPRYDTTAGQESRDFVAGTVVVPMDQRRAKVAAHLLEPEGPDSLVAWGFFNAIFEQKEYAESHVMEPIARRMLERDPALKQEFEEKLRTDEEFAKNLGRRLSFFYRRSPYWDEAMNSYPVARLMDQVILERLRAEAPH